MVKARQRRVDCKGCTVEGRRKAAFCYPRFAQTCHRSPFTIRA